MKRVLITGARSFIGESFAHWVRQWPDNYHVETIDVRGEAWKTRSFSSFDVVYHVAAIVHVKEHSVAEYFAVNRDLAAGVALKAKQEGVRQLIFLSTMNVYGLDTGFINEDTIPSPTTAYAKSKLDAEALLRKMSDYSFKVAVIRPPVVYGKDCRGNYPKLAKVARRVPFFPAVNNSRSMIFIDNLSEFVRLAIDSELQGLFFPQNRDYVSTTELVKLIAAVHGKKMRAFGIMNPIVWLGIRVSGLCRKVFGSLVYDKKMPGGPDGELNCETCSFQESIERTER